MSRLVELRKPFVKVLVLAAYLAVCLYALNQPQSSRETRPLYAHLLYVFVVLGAFLYGLAGALATAAIAAGLSLLYHLGMGVDPFRWTSLRDSLVPLGSFFMVGLVTGGLANRKDRLKLEVDRANETLESEVRRRTLALTEANELLRLASNARTEFLTNASHEFKTPLNAIIGFSDLVLDGLYGPITAEQRKAMEGIQENAEHLLGQVSNLLDIARLESGAVSLSVEAVPVNEVVADVIARNRSLLRRKRLEVFLEPDASVPLLRTDENRLRAVVTNLFSNAIKFTDTGHVRISTHHLPLAKQVEIVFQDTGVGIDPRDHQRIFDTFVQVDGSARRRHEGSGIGLAIVFKTVQRLGGKVSVESERGKGARFRVLLPLEAPAEAPPAAAPGG